MRVRTLALAAASVAALAAGPGAAQASEANALPHRNWSFEGLFGTYDGGALQRGFQVYSEVCAACHSMKLLSYRHLTGIGFTEDQIKQIAAAVQIPDGPNDQGEMFERPGRPSDRFRSPFPNDNAARFGNNGALPPDFSPLVKGRDGGASYVHAVLTGYKDAPAGVTLQTGMSYNAAFPGHQIAMPQPLNEGQVSYADGTSASVDQMAADVATFLAWASEPEMDTRKRMGVKVILFTLLLTGLLYAVKRRVWADVEH
jgi:ubiquinol-cytochrome c reductase cytochrome c1 subunit